MVTVGTQGRVATNFPFVKKQTTKTQDPEVQRRRGACGCFQHPLCACSSCSARAKATQATSCSWRTHPGRGPHEPFQGHLQKLLRATIFQNQKQEGCLPLQPGARTASFPRFLAGGLGWGEFVRATESEPLFPHDPQSAAGLSTENLIPRLGRSLCSSQRWNPMSKSLGTVTNLIPETWMADNEKRRERVCLSGDTKKATLPRPRSDTGHWRLPSIGHAETGLPS